MTGKMRKYNVGKGWWPLLDEYIPKLRALGAEYIDPFQKHGALDMRIRPYSLEIEQLTIEISDKSETICEFCGAPGREAFIYNWISTLCEDCAKAKSQAPRGTYFEDFEKD